MISPVLNHHTNSANAAGGPGSTGAPTASCTAPACFMAVLRAAIHSFPVITPAVGEPPAPPALGDAAGGRAPTTPITELREAAPRPRLPPPPLLLVLSPPRTVWGPVCMRVGEGER